MARTRFPGFLGALSAAAVGSFLATAQAAESVAVPPLYFWGVQHEDGSPDATAEAAVRARLLQAGVTLRPLPGNMAGIACSLAECPQQLKAAASGSAVQVMGAHLETPIGEGSTKAEAGTLWWLDTATGQRSQRHLSCQGCELTEQLAREAAFLVEQASVLPVAVVPPVAVAECPTVTASSPAALALQPPVVRAVLSGGVVLSLRTAFGVKPPAKSLGTDLQSALRQMGLRASQLGGPVEAVRLTIELQGAPEESKSSPIIQTVHLALSGPHTARQMRLYCPPESCGHDLLRFLRVNISALLDGSEPDAEASDLVASAAKCSPAPPTATKVASRDFTRVPAATVFESGASTPVDVAPIKSGRERPLCIAGATLATVGLAGLVPSIVLFTKDQTPTGKTTEFDGTTIPWVWDTFKGSVAGMTLSSLSLAAGAVLISSSYRLAAKKGSPCHL